MFLFIHRLEVLRKFIYFLLIFKLDMFEKISLIEKKSCKTLHNNNLLSAPNLNVNYLKKLTCHQGQWLVEQLKMSSMLQKEHPMEAWMICFRKPNFGR